MGDFMQVSSNKKLNTLFRFIGQDTMSNVEEFVSGVASRDFISFDTEEQITSFFKDYMDSFYSNSSTTDIDNIRYYTGIAFNEVNELLRGMWDYNKSGMLSDDKKSELIGYSNEISNTLSKVPSNLPSDIKVYRGVSLSSFRDYGINSLEDLKNMIGNYYYESGFTSTSLLRDKSFFDRKLEWHNNCNIEIEYSIPKECSDGLPLITDELSYSKVQSEYLINKGSLSKIIDVSFSDDGTKAYLKAVYIPKKIWDKTFEENQIMRH